jgi:hypothetical protein
MPTTEDALRLPDDDRERLEDLLRLLDWDGVPGWEPDNPNYVFHAMTLLLLTKDLILLHGRDWVRDHPEEVLANWRRMTRRQRVRVEPWSSLVLIVGSKR